jgi:hypothetical protein
MECDLLLEINIMKQLLTFYKKYKNIGKKIRNYRILFYIMNFNVIYIPLFKIL